MSDEGVELASEVFESSGAVEGFIEAEESDEDVGLELGEPFIRSGHGAGAGLG